MPCVESRRLWATESAGLVLPVLLLAALRLALWLFPFPWCWFLLRNPGPIRETDSESVERLLSQVGHRTTRASRWVPGAVCLHQALVARWLLARRGCSTRFVLGVAIDGERRLRAHAWLERDQRVVFGSIPSLGIYQKVPISFLK